MAEEVFLDLEKVTLIGFERYKSDRVVNYYVTRIEAGDEFPAVKVYKINDTTYQLTTLPKEGYPDDGYDMDGGHLRAVAHYLAGKPLRCTIEGTRPEVSFRFQRTPVIIRDIVLIPDAEAGKGRYPTVQDLEYILRHRH